LYIFVERDSTLLFPRRLCSSHDLLVRRLAVETALGRVLASAFPQGHARNRPGGGAVMHVTSHISNSQAYFSAHEMPIWGGPSVDLFAEVRFKPCAGSDFAAADARFLPPMDLRDRRQRLLPTDGALKCAATKLGALPFGHHLYSRLPFSNFAFLISDAAR
jgi:hypothetical protein